MKTVRIRKFMVIGMISVVIFPWMVYIIVHFSNPWSNGSWQNQRNIEQVMTEISTQPQNWTDASWQRKLRTRLLRERIGAEILSPNNQQIFKFGFERRNPWMSNNQMTVIENGKILGTVRLYSRFQNDVIASISAMTALIIAISFVGYQMRRSVVKPLEAMSKTARRIAEGEFVLDLPKSKVKEIAEVRSGFEVMVAGLKDAFEQQAKLEEERRFFIGAIAHDLRTPLFALRGYLDGLEQGIASTPEKMAQYVKVCKEKSLQLDRLVSDLFAFTKLEYMEQIVHFEKIDLVTVLERSINSLEPLAEAKEISVDKTWRNCKCEVYGDAHLLERAVSNLLENAIRHTPKRGKIWIQSSHSGGKTWLSIKDSGPGFKESELEHVFEPLYRGEVSRNRETGGAGLGLTIAKRIFIAHGGNLTAANSADGGAVISGWIADSNPIDI